MKRALYSLIFTLFFLSAFAQSYDKNKWWKGSIELNNGNSLKGTIKYDYLSNTLIVKTDNGDKTFVAGDIYTFTLDKVLNEEGELIYPRRHYFSVYEENELGITEPNFYRVLVGGEVSLLTRGKMDYTHMGFEFPQYYIRNEPYLLFRDGRVEKLSIWRKQILNQLGGDKERMLRYVKSNKLDLRTARGLIELLVYFNEGRDS